MKKFKDLTGAIYNGIEVICRDLEKEKEKQDNKLWWKCVCHCGNVFSATSGNIKNYKSCGCLQGGKGKTKNSKENEWLIDGDTAIGITSKGEKFFIDLEDLSKVEKYCWRIHAKYGYVVANSKDTTNKTIWIHRLVMSPNEMEIVDHIDWDKANNKKSNLRICNKSENNVNIKRKSNNTSGYTGVKKSNSGKWVAQISFKGKRLHLGTFENIEDAIVARNKAEKIMHKDFNGELNRQDFMRIFNAKEGD